MNKKTIAITLASIIAILLAYIFLYPDSERTLKKYDPKTKATYTFSYTIKEGDTVIHGKSTKINNQGKLLAKGNFKNGQAVGKWFYYDNNGNIETIYNRKNSKTDAEAIFNYPTGKVRKYALYDEFDKTVFIIRYDEHGNVKSYEGLPLIETYQFKIANKDKFPNAVNQNLKVGDTLYYQYLIANLPNSERIFRIDPVNNSGRNRIITKGEFATIDVKEVLTEKGVNTFSAFAQWKFRDGKKTVINDTITFSVVVN